MVLANTEELHDKIDNLRSRVRDLEDGLRSLHSTVSDQPHPLLRNDLLNIKTSTISSNAAGRNGSPFQATSSSATHTSRLEKLEDDSLIDAFGMLYRTPSKPLLTPLLVVRYIDDWLKRRINIPRKDRTFRGDIFCVLPAYYASADLILVIVPHTREHTLHQCWERHLLMFCI